MRGFLLIPLALSPGVTAAVTLYNGDQFEQHPTPPATMVEALPQYSGLPTYDPLRLEPPPPPTEAVTQVLVNVPVDPVGVGYQLSKQQKGNFLGFSIEL